MKLGVVNDGASAEAQHARSSAQLAGSKGTESVVVAGGEAEEVHGGCGAEEVGDSWGEEHGLVVGVRENEEDAAGWGDGKSGG